MKIVCGSAGHTQLVGLHVDTNTSLGGWHSYFVTVLFLSKQGGGGFLAFGTPHCGATLSNTWQPRGGN